MKTIEINIKDNGNLICKEDNNYVFYKDIINKVIRTSNDNIITKIVDGNIVFRNSYIKITINNYNNNRDIKLDKIIEKIKRVYLVQKRNSIRKQKIKRVKTFAGVAIISLGIIFTNSLINKTDNKVVNDYENIPLSSEVVETNVVINNEEEIKNITNLDIETRTDTEKYKETKEKYYEKIKRISEDYGIDSRIMLAIATQESGDHEIKNNVALGLMQIEASVWDGKIINAYNYSKQENESIKITKEKLKDLDFNIKVACMHFQKCLIDSNYDLNIAIQMYNYGYGNIEKTFKIYHQNNDINLKESLKNYDIDWLNYRYYIEAGDNNYLEHIISYIEDLSNIECRQNNNELISFSYNINRLEHVI